MMLTLFETLLLGIFIAAIVVASHWFGQQAYTWMPVAATAEAEQVDRLFSFLVAVGAFIFLGVIGIILYSILFFEHLQETTAKVILLGAMPELKYCGRQFRPYWYCGLHSKVMTFTSDCKSSV